MKYRGYAIAQEYDLNYYATDADNYDCDWDGESYYQCGGMPTQQGSTVDECKAEIDAYYFNLKDDS